MFEWTAVSSQKMCLAMNVSLALGSSHFEKKLTTIMFVCAGIYLGHQNCRYVSFHLPSFYHMFNPFITLYLIFSFNSTLVKFSQNAKAVQVNKKLAVLLFLCFYMATLWLLKHSWTHLVLSYFSGFHAAGARRTFLADIVLEQIGNFKNSGSIYWASEVWCATKWDNLCCIQFSAELCSHTVKSKH